MPTATETITLQSIVRQLVDSGETDPETVATKATEEALASDDLESIVWGAAHEFARGEIRQATQRLEMETAQGNRPTRNLKKGPDGKPIKATSARANLLSHTIWIPKKGRLTWSVVEIADLKAQAGYMSGQLARHTSTVSGSIEFIDNVTYFLEKEKLRCLADRKGFTWDLIPGFSLATLKALDGGAK